jgi:hypothetical protein
MVKKMNREIEKNAMLYEGLLLFISTNYPETHTHWLSELEEINDLISQKVSEYVLDRYYGGEEE